MHRGWSTDPNPLAERTRLRLGLSPRLAAATSPVRVAAVVLGALLLAAISLAWTSTPAYDAWSWIVWGREILHGDLVTTGGPSWKPLPVLVTAPAAALGSVAPAAWMVVARAGGLLALVVAFRLGRALAGSLAGGLAVLLLAVAPWLWTDVALGNSEGLVALCALGALERAVAGRFGQAWAFGVALGLLRPEAWPFLGVLGLVLVARRRLGVGALLAGWAVQALLWLGPEQWGSGNFWRAADRAQQADALSLSSTAHPALAVVEHAVRLASPVVLLGLALLVALLVARRARPADRVRAALAGVLALTVLWVALVAAMTQAGFAGNPRYLVVPLTLGTLAAACAFALAARAARRELPAPRGRALAAAAAAVAVLGAVATAVRHLPAVGREVAFRDGVAHELPDVVADAGGRDALRRCGPPATAPALVPLVAWSLERHVRDVRPQPAARGVVLAAPVARGAPSEPPLDSAAGWRVVADSAHWRALVHCAGPAPGGR